MTKKRYLLDEIISDLKEKMVFIGGPRQIGKTTLAQFIGQKKYKNYEYLNWDHREDRQKILKGQFRADVSLIIFDEIHKYSQWKNYIKGQFDKYKKNFQIIVTGSSRLDIYRRGGDSLMGRYHYYRLHPFSLLEVLQEKPKINILKELTFLKDSPKLEKIFKDLFIFGGFPEIFLKKSGKSLRRFHNQRIERLIKEDIRDIEQIRDLSLLQVLVELLPLKVGSLLSLNSLREDLEVAHKTISSWMNILEKFYYHFRIYSYSVKTIKSLRKEPKMYLWDWSEIDDESIRLENIVASHLLKFVHFLYDVHGHKAEIFFLRDIEGREVDFLITINKKPWFAVEVKLKAGKISKHLEYFKTKLKIPFSYQITKENNIDFLQNNTRVMSASKFFSGLV